MLASSVGFAADANNTKEGERRFQEGKKLMNAGDFEHARLSFAEAHVLLKSPNALWNMAMCEFYSSHYVESLNHLRELVRDPKADPGAVKESNAKYIPEAAQKVGQVQIEAPRDAVIELDSKEKLGVAPLPDLVAIKPGHHTVVARASSELLTADVDVAIGQTVRIVLKPTQTSTSAASLDVKSLLEPSSSPSNTGEASANSMTPASDAPTKNSANKRYWISGGLAGGAVLLAAGSVTFFALAKSSDDDVRSAQAQHAPGSCQNGCPDLDSALDSRRSRAIVAYALGGGAVLFAVGAGVSWWLLRPRENSGGVGSIQLLPTFAPGHSGLLLRSNF